MYLEPYANQMCPITETDYERKPDAKTAENFHNFIRYSGASPCQRRHAFLQYAAMLLLILTCLYGTVALLLTLYTAGQPILFLSYLLRRRRPEQPPPLTYFPQVTVQLPLYNEQHVVTRLLHAVTALDYPKRCLHIQILDDSTDATGNIVAREVAILRAQGFWIDHLRRDNRSGYKAGALAYGLQHTTSPYIAIFDADFVPSPDFLRRTLPHLLQHQQRGVVQTRWGHLNPETNWLTRSQRLAIDTHFIIEQTARSAAAWFVPFNGSGGVWRSACIRDAGGWQADTLTEDLDLSYRAQLRGWQVVYLPDVVVPGELPPQIAAYRQQQARWAIGSVQCLRRLAPHLWSAKMPVLTRIMALHHLCQYVPQPLILLLLLLTPPMLLTGTMPLLPLAPLGLIGLVPPLMIVVSQRAIHAHWRQLLALPFLVLLVTGLVWSNTHALLSLALGKETPFQRTPKFGLDWQHSRYALRRRFPALGEIILMAYALWGVWLALPTMPTLVPYLLLYAVSFATVAICELSDAWRLNHLPTPDAISNIPNMETAVYETPPIPFELTEPSAHYDDSAVLMG